MRSALVLAMCLLAPGAIAMAGGDESPRVLVFAERLVGPLSSWSNVKSAYGAKGDGRADDTQAFQRALSDLGKEGRSQVLFIPRGTYKISATLYLKGSSEQGPDRFGLGGVALIGQDPRTTILKWDGPVGAPMLVQDGGVGTSYSRLTWDGSGTAGIGVAHWWQAHAGRVYDEGAEHKDETFVDMNIGIMAGRMGPEYGELDSEGTVRRVVFIRNRFAGLDLGSWNALDWWVWDSSFIDCGRGVSNDYSLTDSGETRGAGAAYIYRSTFQRSVVADMKITNTGWFSLHENVSVGSRRFFEASPMGDNAGPVVIEGNRISSPAHDSPISLGNLGPLFLVDNQIASAAPAYVLDDGVRGQSALSMGNSLGSAAGRQQMGDDVFTVDDGRLVGSNGAVSSQEAAAAPGWSDSNVVEMPRTASSADLQAVIDGAARRRQPIVIHFDHGTWRIQHTLRVPPLANIELLGDGYGSVLEWDGKSRQEPMLRIQAPATVFVQNMQWRATASGVGAADAIDIRGADQAGGRIQIVETTLGALRARRLRQTLLSLQSNVGLESVDLSDVQRAVSVGSGPFGPLSLTRGSRFAMLDTWYEGPETALFNLDHATFTYLGGHLAPASHPGGSGRQDSVILLKHFSGQASWIAAQWDLRFIPTQPAVVIAEETPESNVSFLGMSSNGPDFISRASGFSRRGAVLCDLNIIARGSGDPKQASCSGDDTGRVSAESVRRTWEQARALHWDTAGDQPPAHATNIVLYRLIMNKTGGVAIAGD